MKITHKVVMLGVVIALAGCGVAEKQADQRLADQSVMAVNWMQESGEYQAIALQTFYFATQAFDQSATTTTKPRAVVVDLDETMIDNSAYQAWAAQQQVPFTDDTWSQWTRAEQALAIPGALEFAQHVASHGGKMFYVSNRSTNDYTATVNNLRALGFPDVDKNSVLLSSDTSNKQARFEQITTQGYQLVVYVGDNLNDFGAATWHQTNLVRRQFVQQHQHLFGTKFFILPNPSYGDWETGLVPHYGKLSPVGKLHARESALRVWQPH